MDDFEAFLTQHFIEVELRKEVPVTGEMVMAPPLAREEAVIKAS